MHLVQPEHAKPRVSGVSVPEPRRNQDMSPERVAHLKLARCASLSRVRKRFPETAADVDLEVGLDIRSVAVVDSG